MTNVMTSRQRVLAALNHQQPDRVPCDLGGHVASGVSIEACESLYRYLGIAEPVEVLSERGRVAKLAESVLEHLGSDTRPVVARGGAYAVGSANEDGTFTDEWEVVRATSSDGKYYHVIKPPLAGDLTKEVIRAQSQHWPDPNDPALVEGIGEDACQLHEKTDYAVVLSLPLGIFHQVQFLRGFQAWLMDLALDPSLACYLLDALVERWLERARCLIAAAGGNVDVILVADDIAFNKGLYVSPRMYRTLLRPYQARMFSALQGWSTATLLYHSCGDASPVIEDLLDMGVDALNPIQTSTPGLADTAALKRRFGDRIAFWGAVDANEVLRSGTPDDVRAEVCRRVADLGPGGGYVLAASHCIAADVPPENVCAMLEAAHNSGAA